MVDNRALIGAIALLLATTAMSALAHDADVDRANHRPLHQDLRDVQRRPDDRSLRDLNKDRHVDHRGYWHVHYGWGFRYLGPRFWGIGYY
jgi:hypothetical protein